MGLVTLFRTRVHDLKKARVKYPYHCVLFSPVSHACDFSSCCFLMPGDLQGRNSWVLRNGDRI